jgi:hypothetical protein
MKEYIDVGSTSYIVPTSFGVIKYRKRKTSSPNAHPPAIEKCIHALVASVLQHPYYTRLTTPHLNLSAPAEQYEMKRIDTSLFLTSVELKEPALQEYETLLGEMEQKGIVLLDCEFFEQPDGSVMILDFNKCIVMPERMSVFGGIAEFQKHG